MYINIMFALILKPSLWVCALFVWVALSFRQQKSSCQGDFSYNHGKTNCSVSRLGNNLVFVIFLLFFLKYTLCCWRNKKVSCNLFHLIMASWSFCCRLAGCGFFLFQQNDIFINTNEHVWTCWHCAVNMKWCRLALKVKYYKEEHFPH